MAELKTKKDFYNENKLVDKRVHINGETAIKPYLYMRNGLLHARYTVDRCMKLTPDEEQRIKVAFNTEDKQEVLLNEWKLLAEHVGREVIYDGIAEIDKRLKDGSKN